MSAKPRVPGRQAPGRSLLLSIHLLQIAQDEHKAVVFISALTSSEWEDVLRTGSEEEQTDLADLRRLRKLALHRQWRLRNIEQEKERHRRSYQERKARRLRPPVRIHVPRADESPRRLP